MLFKNTSPLGDIYYGQAQRFVKAGETVEATGVDAERMAESGHFTRVESKKDTTSSKEN